LGKRNLNIQFTSYNTVRVLVFEKDKSTRKITIKPVIPKGYVKLVKTLINKALRKEIGYPARIYITDYGEELEHLYGEIQVMTRYDFYLEVMRRYEEPLGNNIAGVDVNVD